MRPKPKRNPSRSIRLKCENIKWCWETILLSLRDLRLALLGSHMLLILCLWTTMNQYDLLVEVENKCWFHARPEKNGCAMRGLPDQSLSKWNEVYKGRNDNEQQVRKQALYLLSLPRRRSLQSEGVCLLLELIIVSQRLTKTVHYNFESCILHTQTYCYSLNIFPLIMLTSMQCIYLVRSSFLYKLWRSTLLEKTSIHSHADTCCAGASALLVSNQGNRDR